MEPKDFISGFLIEKTSRELTDENGISIGTIYLLKSGDVAIAWLAEFFVPRQPPMPDMIRKAVVANLRKHADLVESGRMDKLIHGMIDKPQGETN